MSFKKNPAATLKEISKANSVLSKLFGGNIELPQVLIEFWLKSNGGQGDLFEFYSTVEVCERNETLEVFRFCPGFVAIANDSGSKVALLILEKNSTNVFLSYMGDMSVEGMVSTKLEFNNWIDSGCPFNMEEVHEAYSAIEDVVLRLDSLPINGLSWMMKLKKLLNLSLTMQELKAIESELPYDLCATTYIKALRLVGEINIEGQYVSIIKADTREIMPLDYAFK